MTTTRILALSALLLAACDAEELEGAAALDAEALDAEAPTAIAAARPPAGHRAAGHIDLSVAKTAPWIRGALAEGRAELDAKLGACADVLRAADALTFGAREGAFEVYVEGSFDADAATACTDHIDAEIAARGVKREGHPTPEAVLLTDGVLAVFGGDLTPSRERLDALLAADPSPHGEPMWMVGDMSQGEHPLDRVQAWADPSTGMSAHVEVVFHDEGKATEIYGKATLGLTAMMMSDEVGELASAVELRARGKTLIAEIGLTPDQMTTLVAKGKARHAARMQARAR